MTKEIREGIETILAALEIKHLSSTGYTDEILTYLKSKGCVIKVDKDIPLCSEHPKSIDLNCYNCGLKVGRSYLEAVEELI